MDAGTMNSSSSLKAQSPFPLQELFLLRRNSKENLDRFRPNRSAMDMDYAHYMLTEGRKRKGKDNATAAMMSPSREAYRERLAEALNINRTRILAFKNKPPAPVGLIPRHHLFSPVKPTKPHRCIPQTSERTLEAPDIADDFYLNLLDWGSSNVVAIALENTVYL
ncbi:unnamed protein product [Dovyalis caffra]|uniref:Uncharacterized protein n=1 Tax=Dovyalis caffra TaxID=77055 RepID=A0AAV1SM42_9ROSI|nr:unnamed protein product [Dovyalis caffra]